MHASFSDCNLFPKPQFWTINQSTKQFMDRAICHVNHKGFHCVMFKLLETLEDKCHVYSITLAQHRIILYDEIRK